MRECGWLAYYCTSDKPRLEIRPSCFHWLTVSVQSHSPHVTLRVTLFPPVTLSSRHSQRSASRHASAACSTPRWNPGCKSSSLSTLCVLTHRNIRKSLKVLDLKDILKRASVTVPPQPNKAKLIAAILGAPAAVDVYNESYNPDGVTPQQDASSKPKPDAFVNPPTKPPASPKKVQV